MYTQIWLINSPNGAELLTLTVKSFLCWKILISDISNSTVTSTTAVVSRVVRTGTQA